MRLYEFLFSWFILLTLVSACSQINPPPPTILIDGVIYDGFELANRDELVILYNTESIPVDVGGWQITDGDSRTAVLPPNTLINPQQPLWLTKNGSAFSRRYRFVVDFELIETNPLIEKLSGTWPAFTDMGGQVILLDRTGNVVDVLVYKNGNSTQTGWSGTAVTPTFVIEEGLMLIRTNHLDTNTASEWEHTTHYQLGPRKIGSNIRIGANLDKRPD